MALMPEVRSVMLPAGVFEETAVVEMKGESSLASRQGGMYSMG